MCRRLPRTAFALALTTMLTIGSAEGFDENTFRITDAVVTAPGDDIVVPVVVEHADPFTGFQVVLNWDSTLLDLSCLPLDGAACNVTGVGTDADALLRPQNPQLMPGSEPWEGSVGGGFAEIRFEPGGGGGPNRDLLTVVAFFDFQFPLEPEPILLPATGSGQGQTILFFTFSTTAGIPDGTTTEIRLEDGLGISPQDNFALLESGASVPVCLESGTVLFDSTALLFWRGNPNQDSSIDLGDAVFLLTFLFDSGPAPLCSDAGDANDDGLLDLGDAIFLFSYLFSGGPFPAAPFYLCGVDSTDTDSLDCVGYSGGCP